MPAEADIILKPAEADIILVDTYEPAEADTIRVGYVLPAEADTILGHGACRGRYNTGTRRLQRLIQYWNTAPAEADTILKPAEADIILDRCLQRLIQY